MIRFERFAISAWTVLVMSASLTVVVPNLHWFATGALLPLLLLNNRRSQKDIEIPPVFPLAAAILILSMLIVSLQSEESVRDFGQCAKIALILLLVLPMVVRSSARRNALWAGAEAAVYFNVLLIIGGLTISPLLFGVQATARFGTYATPPGGLWQVGAIGLAASGLLPTSGSRAIKLRRAICVAASILFIVLDGSRTGILVLSAALALYAPRVMGSSLRRPLRTILIALSIVTLAAFATPLIGDFFDDYGVVTRVRQALEKSGSGTSSVGALDSARTVMYLTVLNAIEDHPIVGSGLNTTFVDTEFGTEVVHCSYLQVWADVGLLGFLAYTTLTQAPLLAALQHQLHRDQEATRDALPAIFLACAWALMGCFHPVSTELTEWIWFFLLIAALGNCGVYSSRWTPSVQIPRTGTVRNSTLCA